MGLNIDIGSQGPVYNKRIGSGNISQHMTFGNKTGGRTAGGAVYVDVDFNWYGGSLTNDVDAALIETMDAMLDKAVKLAKPLARYRTGDLRGSIMKLQIVLKENVISGSFGSGLHYALFQELGTFKFAGTFYLTGAGNAVIPMFQGELKKHLKAKGW